jgi:hypothetical protein
MLTLQIGEVSAGVYEDHFLTPRVRTSQHRCIWELHISNLHLLHLFPYIRPHKNTPQRTPCDLSVLLLTELKEILKTYCQSPAGAKNSKKTSHTFSKVRLVVCVICGCVFVRCV